MRPAAALLVAACLAAPLQGCLASRERTVVPVAAELLDLELWSAPVLASGATVAGALPAPDAMGVATLRLSVPEGLLVELTGFVVSATNNDTRWGGDVAQVEVEPGRVAPRDGGWPHLGGDGTRVRIHFRLLDEDGVPVLASPQRVRVAVEAWWRYDVADRFDAGRVRVEEETTVVAAAASDHNGADAQFRIEGQAPGRLTVGSPALAGVTGGGTVFLVGRAGDAVSVEVAPDADADAWSGRAPARVPASLAFAILVAPWPLDQDAPADVVVVTGPEGLERTP